MDRRSPLHPYACKFDPSVPDDDERWLTFDEAEAVLQTLDNVHPLRIERKRRDFRRLDTDQALSSMRAELLFAAYLARHEVRFDFGGGDQPQPDLVLADSNLAIEITAKTSDHATELYDLVSEAVRSVDPTVTVGMQFSATPFSIRGHARTAVVNAVLHALEAGDAIVEHEVRPANDGIEAITSRITLDHRSEDCGERRVQSGPLLTPLMSDVEAAVAGVMADDQKRAQIESMPTVLMVDISSISGAWLRPMNVWLGQLQSILQDEHAVAALGVMVTSGWQPDIRLAMATSPIAPPDIVEDIEQLQRSLGLIDE
jgi:hypothetical protein